MASTSPPFIRTVRKEVKECDKGAWNEYVLSRMAFGIGRDEEDHIGRVANI